MMENPIKMDDLGVPLFMETPIYKPSFATTITGKETNPNAWELGSGSGHGCYAEVRHVSAVWIRPM